MFLEAGKGIHLAVLLCTCAELDTFILTNEKSALFEATPFSS